MSAGRWKRAGWLTLAGIGVIAFCLVTATWIVNSIDYKNNDYISFHLAGYMVVYGEDPYFSEQWVAGHEKFDVTWISDQTFIYPLPLALVFVPLSPLPLYQSYIAWTALSLGMILLSFYLLVRLKPKSYPWLLITCLCAGLILFRPTILTLVNGQLTALLLLVLTGVLHLWNKDRWEWGALLLSVLILKPNLGAPILLLLGLWLVLEKKYKAVLALILGGAILLVIGLMMNPAWVQEYLGIGGGKVQDTFGFSPTAWGLGSLLCDFRSPRSLLVGGAGALLLLLAAAWLYIRGRVHTPSAVIPLVITTGLLVTPYSWTYDQLLLVIPIIMTALALAERKRGLIPAALLFPGMALLSLIMVVPDNALGIEILNVFIPLGIFILLLWSMPGKKIDQNIISPPSNV
jgi:hypothetical protein